MRSNLQSWRWTILISGFVLSVGIILGLYVHQTTTEVREALAAEVLEQQHDVASLIQEYSAVMLELEHAQHEPEAEPVEVTTALDMAIEQLSLMRSTYSFASLDGAVKAHAFARPVLEDVQQWLTTGLPGTDLTRTDILHLAADRMKDRYNRLRLIVTETESVAKSLIDEQSENLVRFRNSLIVFLIAYVMALLGIATLLIRQRNLQVRLATEQDQANRLLIDAETRGREQAEEALTDSEKFLRSTLNAVPAEIAIVSSSGIIKAVNTAWQKLAMECDPKIPRGGVDQSYLDVFKARPPPEFQRVQEIAADITDVLQGKRDVLHHEYPCHLAEHQLWVVVTLTTFTAGEDRYAVLIREDVTKRKQLEERDRRLRAELAHAARLTTVSEMAAGLAHELNQPLTAISHNSDALRSSIGKLTDSGDEAIEISTDIYNQAQRAGGIIKSLRHLMRKDTVYTSSVEFNHLVEETVRLTHPEAREQRVSVTLNLDENLPNPEIDPIQIQQVLVNLERNGVEAMGNNTDKARDLVISTSLVDSNTIKVSVEDTGPGFTPAMSKQLFSAFQTTKKNGMGLGLSISRSIVESHGGRLWLDQPSNGRTTLHFTLPVVRG